jgi:hypothetical protein
MWLSESTTMDHGKRYTYLRFRCRTRIKTLGTGYQPCAQSQGVMSARKLEASVIHHVERVFGSLAGQPMERIVKDAHAEREQSVPGWAKRERDTTAKIARLREKQEAINEARIDKRYTREQANTKWQECEVEIERLQRALGEGPMPADVEGLRRFHELSAQLVGGGLAALIEEEPRQFRGLLARLGVRVVVRDGVAVVEGLEWVT